MDTGVPGVAVGADIEVQAERFRYLDATVATGGKHYRFFFPRTEACRAILAKVRSLIGDFDTVVTRNRIFVDRLKDTGVISKEDCLRYAVTGPILRSAGDP